MRNNLSKITLTAIAVNFALSTSFAANIPKYCTEEIITISKGNGFDIEKFISDLPPAVAKAKLQAKAPFGKPKDSDKTDIGMTFGCLKSFPESLGEIQSLLKDVSLETAKSAVTSKPPEKKENSTSFASENSSSSVSKSSGPALKECDAIFNPSKKFCYDGGVYDLCDGMTYNPTTHICSGDIANRALCNGAQYNPLKQKCENNVLREICGKTVYNPATHSCKNNTVFALTKCGKNLYDPTTHGCYNNTLFPKCGEALYDPKTQGCKDNVLLLKCGEVLYNPKMYECKDNVMIPKCGEILYDSKTHGCKDNALFALPKCGETLYDPRLFYCKNNVLLGICGKILYDLSINSCKDNELLMRCGPIEFYNPKTQECSYGSVFDK